MTRIHFTLAFLFLFSLLASPALAQQSALRKPSERTQTFVMIGAALPYLNSGGELLRSADLRSQGLGYFQDASGNRKNVGSYGPPAGTSIALGFYQPLAFVKGLMLGGNADVALTGTQPSGGGYAEGYFFNFVAFSASAKYYALASLSDLNFFLKVDAGLSSVFTKNRFANSMGEQNFFHQFGIGTQAGLGVGYTLTPFPASETGIDVLFQYRLLSSRVEVDGIGDDIWNYSALTLQIGIVF